MNAIWLLLVLVHFSTSDSPLSFLKDIKLKYGNKNVRIGSTPEDEPKEQSKEPPKIGFPFKLFTKTPEEFLKATTPESLNQVTSTPLKKARGNFEKKHVQSYEYDSVEEILSARGGPDMDIINNIDLYDDYYEAPVRLQKPRKQKVTETPYKNPLGWNNIPKAVWDTAGGPKTTTPQPAMKYPIPPMETPLKDVQEAKNAAKIARINAKKEIMKENAKLFGEVAKEMIIAFKNSTENGTLPSPEESITIAPSPELITSTQPSPTYPPNPGYPSPYPPPSPGYPQPGYPPPPNPGYPPPAYSPQSHGYPPLNHGYAPPSSGYPGYPSPGYPPYDPHYPSPPRPLPPPPSRYPHPSPSDFDPHDPFFASYRSRPRIDNNYMPSGVRRRLPLPRRQNDDYDDYSDDYYDDDSKLKIRRRKKDDNIKINLVLPKEGLKDFARPH